MRRRFDVSFHLLLLFYWYVHQMQENSTRVRDHRTGPLYPALLCMILVDVHWQTELDEIAFVFRSGHNIRRAQCTSLCSSYVHHAVTDVHDVPRSLALRRPEASLYADLVYPRRQTSGMTRAPGAEVLDQLRLMRSRHHDLYILTAADTSTAIDISRVPRGYIHQGPTM